MYNNSDLNGTYLCSVKIFSQRYRRLRDLKFNKMNTTTVKGSWNEQKGKLKKQFAVLTDNDLMFEEGKKDEMLGKLQIKLGKTKDEWTKILASL